MAEQSHYISGELLGVHVISEQIFCPRAALCAHSESQDDMGREQSILRLDYAPSYTIAELEKQLDAQATLIWQITAAAIGFALLGYLLSFLHWTFFWSGLLACAFLVRKLSPEVRIAWQLLQDRKSVTRAIPIEPSRTIPQDEPVNWWSLHAVGYVPHPTDETFADEELGIQGKPWRILRRGNLAIPAFVRSKSGALQQQQRARIAAYCHLIRVNMGAESPFGLVLNRGTFDGLAVKLTPNDLRLIENSVRRTGRILGEWLTHGSFPAPPNAANSDICSRCPHGQPRPYVPGSSETRSYGHTVAPYQTEPTTKRKGIFHSPCGDHFGWIPPHQDAEAMGLRPARRG